MILALNCGSSSLKYALFDRAHARLLDGEVRGLGGAGAAATQAHAVEQVFAELTEKGAPALEAVAHRLVHGGPALHAPMRLDAAALEQLRAVVHFAPLHLPIALAVIDAVRAQHPRLAQLGVFDTDFHWHLPEVARRLPIPRALHDRGIRRYGFHGLSYAWAAHALGPKLGARAVVAHLGSGASLAALRDGRSIDTTMSFTPTSGIPSATRSGDLDPGVLLFLLRRDAIGADALEDRVAHQSGLAGISEGSGDVQKLLAQRAADPRAALAIDAFVMAIRKQVGALAACLGGLDTLVFTGGIGEHAREIRAEVCAGLGHLGLVLDAAANEEGAPILSANDSRCVVRVLRADEEQMMSRAARPLLAGAWVAQLPRPRRRRAK